MIMSKRITAALLAALFFASSVMITGCSKKKGSEAPDRDISPDEPWYSLVVAQIGQSVDRDRSVDYFSGSFIGSVNDRFAYWISGQYTMPEEVTDINYTDYMINYLEIYGADGRPDKIIDLRQKVSDSAAFIYSDEEISKYRETYKDLIADKVYPDMPQSEWYIGQFKEMKDGHIVFNASLFHALVDKVETVSTFFEFTLDIESGEIISFEDSEQAADGVVTAFKEYDFEGYKTGIFFDPLDDSQDIKVVKPDGSKSEIKLDQLSGDFISGMMYEGDGKAVAAVGGFGFGSDQFYEIDLNNGSVKEYAQIQDDIKNYFGAATYVNGVGNVIADSEGVKTIDVKSGKKSLAFSFEHCNINRSITNNMQIIAMTEDHIYMTPSYIRDSEMYSEEIQEQLLFVLTKEKTNPNAGKKVLLLATTDLPSYSECEAVSVFNETNPEYFIRYDTRYWADKKIDQGELSIDDEDFSVKYSKLRAELAYQLLVDLETEDGPDIVLDGNSISKLNKSGLLMDLKKEIQSDGCFANALTASDTDGSIYQYPLAFGAAGILMNKKDLPAGQTGFDFGQYPEFVKTTCNGKDPLGDGRLDFLLDCLSASDVKYSKDGKISFDTENFRALAGYISKNVNEKADPNAYEFIEPVENREFSPSFEGTLSLPFMIYFYSDSIDKLSFAGTPSNTGSAPRLSVYSTVAISAHTKQKEACIAFVKTLLSDEIQQSFLHYEGYTPVIKDSFEKAADAAIEKYNRLYNMKKNISGRKTLMADGMPWCEIDKSAIKSFEAMLDSCVADIALDSAITAILKEEMPAYFAGQKDLDQVIKVIDNRCQTYLSERG